MRTEEQKERARQASRRWQLANPEKNAAKARRWAQANLTTPKAQRLVDRIDSAELATEVRQLLAAKFGKTDLFGVAF